MQDNCCCGIAHDNGNKFSTHFITFEYNKWCVEYYPETKNWLLIHNTENMSVRG